MKHSAFITVLVCVTFAGCAGPTAQVADQSGVGEPAADPVAPPAGAVTGTPDPSAMHPHVLVGIPDSGINPYHEIFRRPDLTAEPCTYLPLPCDMVRLDLTLDTDYETALAADEAVWAQVDDGGLYWIPGTAIVGAYCHERFLDSLGRSDNPHCVLDGNGHGTGTASSVLMEEPDALLFIIEGNPFGVQAVKELGVEADIWSYSWATLVPLPIPRLWNDGAHFGADPHDGQILEVYAAANDPRPGFADRDPGDPHVISVSGAYTEPRSHEVEAGTTSDVVSYWCRPGAVHGAITGTTTYCGNSFATPTVAGAVAKIVLALRRESGYVGSTINGTVDPFGGFSVADIREALNVTATYTPQGKYTDRAAFSVGVPLVEQAPWLQWGWGFMDGDVADAAIAHLMDSPAPDKSAQTQAFMMAQLALRTAMYTEREPPF